MIRVEGKGAWSGNEDREMMAHVVIGYCGFGAIWACTTGDNGLWMDMDGDGWRMITPCWLSGLIVRLPGCRGDMTENLACPLMGLFGAEDNSPTLQDVAHTEEELKRFSKTYDFHTYENAGHAFFFN